MSASFALQDVVANPAGRRMEDEMARLLASPISLRELIAARWGRQPAFRLLGQRLGTSRCGPLWLRLSSYSLGGRPVSYHAACLAVSPLEPQVRDCLLQGASLGEVMAQRGWERRQLQVSWWPAAPSTFPVALSWLGQWAPFPFWLRTFAVFAGPQPLAWVWEALPAQAGWPGEVG